MPAARHAVAAGNPVRAGIAALAAPETRFAGRTGALRLLVIGGSLGAQALNRVVPQAIARLPAAMRPQVHHQTGQAQVAGVQQRYQELGCDARVEAFIEDMAAAYAWADLVVCRSGALTVAELAAAGVASILVPYPHATDDHQTGNARYLADAGAALLMPQATLSDEWLSGALSRFTSHRETLLAMAQRARELARPDAARRVALLCLEAAGITPAARWRDCRSEPDAASHRRLPAAGHGPGAPDTLRRRRWRRHERHRRGAAQPRLRGERFRSARERSHAPAEPAGRQGLGRP